MTLLPHSQETKKKALAWLGELDSLQQANGKALAKSSAFVELYKATLAIDALLVGLADAAPRRDLTSARLAARAVLALACSGLFRGARVELRRTIEAAIVAAYFQDHPVEFDRMSEAPRQGFATDPKKPISFAAFREFSYYANYASERLEREPSSLAADALNVLTTEYGNVSAAVHASAVVPVTVLPEPLEVTEAEVLQISRLARRVFAAIALVMSAFRKNAFNNLPPMTRGWFDWLIGQSRCKSLRAGPYGLD